MKTLAATPASHSLTHEIISGGSGLVLTYAFAHTEAIRSFKEAAARDPALAPRWHFEMAAVLDARRGVLDAILDGVSRVPSSGFARSEAPDLDPI